jgi:hypothetical protein
MSFRSTNNRTNDHAMSHASKESNDKHCYLRSDNATQMKG